MLTAAALALLLAGPGPRSREARPILTSLGVTRPDGTPVGVVGGRERFRLQAPPGLVFREVVWEIEGAIAKQEVGAERGFVNTPLPRPLVSRPAGDATESIVAFFWDGTARHSIRVRATYTDGTTATPDGFSPPTRD